MRLPWGAGAYVYTGTDSGCILTGQHKDTHMNETEALQPVEIVKPAVVTKISTLEAQKNAIDAGSTGSAVFRSAAAYLAAHPKAPVYQP